MTEYPEVTLPEVDAWRVWRDQHEDSSDGVWLVLAKQGLTKPTFEVLGIQGRHHVLHPLRIAPNPRTRAQRTERFVEKLNHGETPQPGAAQPTCGSRSRKRGLSR